MEGCNVLALYEDGAPPAVRNGRGVDRATLTDDDFLNSLAL